MGLLWTRAAEVYGINASHESKRKGIIYDEVIDTMKNYNSQQLSPNSNQVTLGTSEIPFIMSIQKVSFQTNK